MNLYWPIALGFFLSLSPVNLRVHTGSSDYIFAYSILGNVLLGISLILKNKTRMDKIIIGILSVIIFLGTIEQFFWYETVSLIFLTVWFASIREDNIPRWFKSAEYFCVAVLGISLSLSIGSVFGMYFPYLGGFPGYALEFCLGIAGVTSVVRAVVIKEDVL